MWGITPHITKYVTKTNETIDYITLRGLVEVVILLSTWAALRNLKPKRSQPIDSRMWWVLLGGSMTMGGTFWFSHVLRASKHISVLVALMYPLGIAFTILFGKVLRDERVTVRRWMGIALCMLSCVVMA